MDGSTRHVTVHPVRAALRDRAKRARKSWGFPVWNGDPKYQLENRDLPESLRALDTVRVPDGNLPLLSQHKDSPAMHLLPDGGRSCTFHNHLSFEAPAWDLLHQYRLLLLLPCLSGPRGRTPPSHSEGLGVLTRSRESKEKGTKGPLFSLNKTTMVSDLH